jgi:hypothetical protein
MKTAQHMREIANSKTIISLEEIEKRIESQAMIGEYSYTLYDRAISNLDIERLKQSGYVVEFFDFPTHFAVNFAVKFSYTISWGE